MMLSMTGYGKAELNLTNANFTIEVKSLNSKQIDVNVKMSSIYREKEIGLRKLLSEKLVRGKVELSIWREEIASASRYSINKEVVKAYHQQIDELRKELGYKESFSMLERGIYRDIMQTMVRMPDIMVKGEEAADENEWQKVEEGVRLAISNLVQFRIDEGKKLEEDIRKRINIIAKLLEDIAPLAKQRIEKVKSSLQDKLADLKSKNIDENRLEQELIYYLEKQDITEEQVRLSAHLNYFLKTMEAGSPNGKKLGFIGQEIGREINTIGSKSSEAGMQKVVVQMKDELEKIKEQLLNVL